MKFKKSQAQIIVTVLIILIVIAAVAILANVLISWIRTNAQFNTVEINLGIEKAFYNQENKTVFIEVKRYPGQSNLTGIRFLVAELTYDVGINNILLENERKVYALENVEIKPEYAEIAPRVTVNGVEKQMGIVSKKEIITTTETFTNVIVTTGEVPNSPPLIG